MKALSFQQPWAWALFHGKDIDNRLRRTAIRGEIYIHTSKTFDMKGWQWLSDNANRLVYQLPHFIDFRAPDKTVDMEMGAIIGTINIDDCVENHGSRWYFGQPYIALIVSNPILFDKAIPYKGQLGFFEVSEQIRELAK